MCRTAHWVLLVVEPGEPATCKIYDSFYGVINKSTLMQFLAKKYGDGSGTGQNELIFSYATGKAKEPPNKFDCGLFVINCAGRVVHGDQRIPKTRENVKSLLRGDRRWGVPQSPSQPGPSASEN